MNLLLHVGETIAADIDVDPNAIEPGRDLSGVTFTLAAYETGDWETPVLTALVEVLDPDEASGFVEFEAVDLAAGTYPFKLWAAEDDDAQVVTTGLLIVLD